MTLLRIEALDVFHGASQVLRGLDLAVAGGEILCLMGRNGAGKTSLMRAIMGTLPRRAGRVLLDDTDISALPAHLVPRHGIAHVPQGRRLFAELTVAENLEIGEMVRHAGQRDFALSLFPVLGDRLGQQAGTLSGGEQTMLAIARAICAGPRVMLLDEPTEGLMPSAIATIRSALIRLRAEGVAVLLVEQRAEAVLAMADRVAFIAQGRIVAETPAEALRADRALIRRYVGLG
ncbi:ABC transporter ATP-binding protein [Sinirhodobacter populi]|uniref:ABC transporter ATP-binding protein n=1 Tax=Paenirhodobacter populi TaxID=2306993 RepID=A0A443J074_9RHOB|nr:ABC transporter ATP-binding protein [Sinirhodobacter populi]RWR13854.1 ABC transporter ATP-binding protein [Sinirhodobacter populi]